MSIEAQIALITVPQEFTRLCNALLAAEHGSDYLPIDDDRADRGNDGYLKSEKRMFAGHCFKRIQNKGIDTLIRGKMVGDLGKATALKEAGVWEIEAWTFVSTYPVEEQLAAEIMSMGRKASIDVAWMGPTDLAMLFNQHHSEVAPLFPALTVNQVSQQLEDLQQSVDALGADDPAETRETSRAELPTIVSMSRDQLAEERPPAWELLLFLKVLEEGRNRLESKWRDQELALPRGPRTYLDFDDVANAMSRALGRLSAILDPLNRVFEAQEDAFGAPGEPGDPVLIEHFAGWIISAYEQMLDWGAEMRALTSPSGLKETISTHAKIVDRPLEQMREFLNGSISDIAKIPPHLAVPEEEREPLLIERTLVVSLDDALVGSVTQMLRDALEQHYADLGVDIDWDE